MDPEEDIDQDQGPEESQPSENQDRNSPQNPSHNPRVNRANKIAQKGNKPGKPGGAQNEKSSMGGKLKDKFNPRKKLQDAKEQLKKAGKDAVKKAAKQASQKAVAAAAENPYVLVVVGIVLLVIFIIYIIVVIISGGGAGATPSGDTTAPLTITKTGPDQADINKNPQLDYQIAVSYPGTAQDIVITDRIPDGTEYISSSPSATFDPITKTASWSAKAVLGTISNINTTFTLTLKAIQDNTNLVNIAQGTVVGAGGDGDVPSCTPNGSPDAEAKWQQVLQLGQKYDPVWIEFLNAARTIAQQEDYPIAVILGQGALESAHGTSNIAKTKKNFFGFMAYDSNTNAARTYPTAADSIKDYVKLIKRGNGGKNARYLEAYASRANPIKMVELIKAGGYATDPAYVQKVTGAKEFQALAGVSLPCTL